MAYGRFIPKYPPMRNFLLSILMLSGSFLVMGDGVFFRAPIARAVEPSVMVVKESAEYFPDQQGNEWIYRGTMIEGGMVQIDEGRFTNVSKVMGTETIDGVAVTVFHDTNPGDQGPSDSYYLRDVAGIRYYGSKPGTTLERQLVPYQIVRFPLEIPSSFEQLNRQGLNLGLDLDRDGESEEVDVIAMVTVQGRESVTVPAGTYPEAIKLEARMTMDVRLSESGVTIKGTDVMTAWFAKGVGLVKYVERQTIPSPRNQDERMVEVIEELEKFVPVSEQTSLRGSKSSS